MSTKPSLPQEDDVLEAPEHVEKPKGMVPRSSVFFAALAFVGVIFLFAFYDLVIKEPAAPKPAASNSGGEGASSGVKAALGPEPSPQDIAARAENQVKAAEVEKQKAQEVVPVVGQPPMPPLPGMPAPMPGTPMPPAGAVRGASANMPLPMAGNQGAAGGNVNARAEIQATRSESDLFALSPSGEGGAISAAKSLATLPSPPGLEPQDGRKRGMDSGQDAAAEAIAAMQRAMADDKPQSVEDKDERFLRQLGERGNSGGNVTYAQQAPTKNIIFAGTRIPIVIREGINSDLPGRVTATATVNVYDSIEQCRLLIPAGAKFFGSYSSQIRPGQARILLGFNRMILPDGRSVDLGAAQGSDAQGATGIEGDVNNHFFKMFGYSFAMALLADKATGGANYTVTQPGGPTTTTSVAGQILAQTANQVIARNAGIPPTISVPPGQPMFLTMVRDIGIQPSRNICR